jgi:hypothetical protein
MTKRKPKIIKDNKRRGEWAESVFAVRAAENGLPVSKPIGESGSFDCVIGRPGKFVGVQVKCTMVEMKNGKGYVCSVKKNNQTYRAAAFDFLAAYVIPEDAWYIVPAKLIRRQRAICLCTTSSEAKYEEYREAWHLLRKASGMGGAREEAVSEPEETAMSPGLARMQSAMNSFRNHIERSGRARR